MKSKINLELFEASQSQSGSDHKKGLTYYLPIILLGFLALAIITEIKYRSQIDRFVIQYIFGNE